MTTLNFITADIGKKQITVYNPKTKTWHVISTDDFMVLNVPELFDGMTIIIEDAHLRAQEEDSKAQTYTVEQLRQIKNIADERNITILCFPQKVTPKTRKIYTVFETDDKKLISKTDKNDTLSIAYYIEKFPHVIDSLKEFYPTTGKNHEEKNLHIFEDRSKLTEDSNLGRNRNYGLSDKDNDDAVSEWIRKYITILYSNLPQDTRDYFKLTLNKKGNGLVSSVLNYTKAADTILKQIYNVVNTILTPEGDLRVRSDIGKVPYWKYAKQVYFGLTPYHSNAGVTASNWKWHKRKAGNKNKISMAFDEKTNAPKDHTFKSMEDLETIREEMKYADKQLKTLWRTTRKMIVEDGLR
tara:strand:- start:425 stop:1486 length:1062 start_codon:yes stop_codon:yes gene_type:complete